MRRFTLYFVLFSQVLEGRRQYVEMGGNIVPVTKSGDQLFLNFRAFNENRLPFTVRVRDVGADGAGRIAFMTDAKSTRGDVPQQPICTLNIALPEFNKASNVLYYVTHSVT